MENEAGKQRKIFWQARAQKTAEIGPENILETLRGIGQARPLGCLPLDTISRCGVTPEELSKEARGKGNSVLLVPEIEATGGKSGRLPSLVVWNQPALEQVLLRHQQVLKRAGWPADVCGFIGRLMDTVAMPAAGPLYDLITQAFGGPPFHAPRPSGGASRGSQPLGQ